MSGTTDQDAPTLASLELRSGILQSLRRFFLARDYLEVETPARIPRPALELHIDAEPSGRQFLRTSPELHMKRLLAGGCERIFQIGPCFRRGESGRLHNPEFTMLEWYCVGADYRGVLAETQALVRSVVADVLGGAEIDYAGTRIDVAAEWACLSVSEAFGRWAGWDPVRTFDADRFDLDLVAKVEPHLPADRPAVLIDYPAEQATLARLNPSDPHIAERWELYMGGIELANAFSELTDAQEQRRRFEVCAEQRHRLGRPVYPPDEAFLAALAGVPPCGGVALGVDRLVMLFAGADELGDVRMLS